ncbi:alpha/beta hydrolase [Longispora sp. NPDC051575]|uniref:alpha/beta fold hydrolase n=1 Tax=Longispora sp. NPDC051575 TaxID=3154943 RepID=UPI00343275D4
MESVEIPVADGSLHALRFGHGPRTILAAHGITASAMSFRSVARHLTPDWSLVALDLRGRGGSAAAPGPYGMTAHAADLAAAAEYLGAPVVLTGQSMGAYAALRAAALRPELFSRVVLVDGGLPLPVPAGADPDEVLRLTVGPAIARLTETYRDVDAYLDFFRAHPALGGSWNEDMDAYVRYDAVEVAGGSAGVHGAHAVGVEAARHRDADEPPRPGTEAGADAGSGAAPGAVRSRTSADAVRADGRDLIVGGDAFGADLAGLSVPAVLLHAPRGMFGQEPGLLPQAVVDHWVARSPALSAELVADTNHYTILMTDRPAALIAERLTTDN